ncbi:MAG: type I-U CRISPR-associated protein Cas5/Cas6 [Planctomycetes bacterium]|nr:type I-U CRISPR-associated protein Cas5/Cas6 [Planctomycetota bacterium]
MFALEVEYLTGRAVASRRHDREAAEWPPHPGRLFSALVATLKECELGEAEREALFWLERQPPPSLSVGEATARDVVRVFVPVNDTSAPDKVPPKGFSATQISEGIKVLPDRRSRQQRAFPSVTLAHPVVHFIWAASVPEEVNQHYQALDRLARHVTYLGHSSSLVRISVCHEPPPPTLVPTEAGEEVLRVPTQGRLVELEETYQRGAPISPGIFRAYARIGKRLEDPADTVFGDMIVFRRVGGPRLPLHASPNLTSTVRRALMALAGPHPGEIISGHAPDGSPSQQPHVAIIPLAYVAHTYADGNIMGFAVVLPRRLGRFDPTRRQIAQALVRLESLEMGRAGVWKVERVTGESVPRSLQVDPYTGLARLWATVTPMLLDYIPKDKPGKDQKAIVATACERIGLPRPVEIEIGPVSPFRGVPPSGHFARLRNGKQPHLHRTHIVAEFDRPVRGPVILGAGRYLGMGLCRRLGRPSEGGDS